MTGGESGTYYAYGSVLAQYATNGDYGVSVTALSSNGSQANVQALQDGDADIVFCQSDVTGLRLRRAPTCSRRPAPYTDFSMVATLYQEQVQIVTCDPDIKTVADLAGKTVSVGAANSGVYFNAVDVLSAYDLTLDDITPVYQSFADSADSLKDDKIDAAFIVAGAPTTAITDLSTTKTAYLVSMDDEHVEKLMRGFPVLRQGHHPGRRVRPRVRHHHRLRRRGRAGQQLHRRGRHLRLHQVDCSTERPTTPRPTPSTPS